MKQLSTIICSLLFVIAGAMVIGMKQNRASPTIFPGNATSYAAPQHNYNLLPNGGLPLDVQLDLLKGANPDTVYIDTSRVDTVVQVKYKTKIRKVTVPEVVEVHDTSYVPVFYIATPLEHEVESTEIRVINDVHVDSSLKTNQTDPCGCQDTLVRSHLPRFE